MRLSRIGVIGFLGILLASLASAPAGAGGSWVKVMPRSEARVGSEIRLGGTFCDGQQAPVIAGPWYAYLVADGRPPVLVGRVHIAPNTGDYCQWRLSATLRVPRAAPGAYWLNVCDRGCTQGVGDLIGAGRFVVLGSASPKAIALDMQRLRTRLREAAWDLARQERLLMEVEEDGRSSEASNRELRGQVTELRDQLATERLSRRAWIVGAVSSWVVAAAIGLVLLRRRRPAVTVPDTPEELQVFTSAHR